MAEVGHKLLVATTSAGKLREWQSLLADLPLSCSLCGDVGIDFDVDETGATYAANALLKAEAYGTASGLLTLAEDSGLSVAALQGGPGVRSARWEGDDYAHKNALLIQLLEGKQGTARALPLRVRGGGAPSRRSTVARAGRSARADRAATGGQWRFRL